MKSFHDSRFTGIQVLRGIAILCIVFRHVRFIGRGEFGVDIFFCISGFAMMLSTHRGAEHYWKKRLIRILPLYSVMTLGTFLLLVLFPAMFENTTARVDQLLLSLFYIPFDIGGGVIAPILRVGWTINMVMYFYLVFFIALKISKKYRGYIASALIILMVAIEFIHPSKYAAIKLYGGPVALNFVFGMALYPVLQRVFAWLEGENAGDRAGMNAEARNRRNGIAAWISLAVSIAMLVILFIPEDALQMLVLSYRVPLREIPAAILVIGFFIMGQVWKMPGPLILLGDISYSLCLVHYYPILFLDRKIFDFEKFSPVSLLGVMVGIMLVIALSYVSYRVVEKNPLLMKLSGGTKKGKEGQEK